MIHKIHTIYKPYHFTLDHVNSVLERGRKISVPGITAVVNVGLNEGGTKDTPAVSIQKSGIPIKKSKPTSTSLQNISGMYRPRKIWAKMIT